MEALTQGLGQSEIIKLLLTNIVAFVIFVWVLRKYAWGPLMGMLDARRDKIAADYGAAQSKLDEAESLRSKFDSQLAEIKVLERERTQEAVKRGEEIATNIEREARGKASSILDKAQADLDQDVSTARVELRNQVVAMSIAAAEMLVKEKLDDQKHRQLVEDFIAELGDLRAE